MKRIALFLIRIYQWTIRPLIGNACRFYPSCSDFAREAIEKRGCVKGSWLVVRRLVRCHPWNPGGYDPVPGQELDR